MGLERGVHDSIEDKRLLTRTTPPARVRPEYLTAFDLQNIAGARRGLLPFWSLRRDTRLIRRAHVLAFRGRQSRFAPTKLGPGPTGGREAIPEEDASRPRRQTTGQLTTTSKRTARQQRVHGPASTTPRPLAPPRVVGAILRRKRRRRTQNSMEQPLLPSRARAAYPRGR